MVGILSFDSEHKSAIQAAERLVSYDYIYSDTNALRESLYGAFLELAMQQREKIYEDIK